MPRWMCPRPPAASDVWHGLQLAARVVAAYAASALLRLPEGQWAVMSALIVLRPTAGATAGAGWDRVRGTLAGALAGLAAVAVVGGLHAPQGASWPLLASVAAIAFLAGLHPALRSAPVSALIVLASAGAAGHTALQVALLRSVEIGLGVAVGIGVSWALPDAGVHRRFGAACAGVLRDTASRVRRELSPPAGDDATTGAAQERLRADLRAVAIMAVNVDHQRRLMALGRRREGAAGPADACQRTARLLARTVQDAGLFARLAEPGTPADMQDRQALADAVAEALEQVADGLAPQPQQVRAAVASPAVARLRGYAAGDAPGRPAWAAPPARLLARDLAGLQQAAATPGRA